MKQNIKKIITIAIIAAIIIGGIVVVNVLGFEKELKYKQGQSVDIYIEQEVNKIEVKEIVNEVLGKNNMVQTIEIYEDMVTIKATSITEEQKNNIVSKLKEKYEFDQKAEDTKINVVPVTRIRDIYKEYVLPIVISAVLVVAYMVIRYYKKGIWNVLVKAIAIPVVAELLLLSVVAIARIPVGRTIPVLVILVYIVSVLYAVRKIERIEK